MLRSLSKQAARRVGNTAQRTPSCPIGRRAASASASASATTASSTSSKGFGIPALLLASILSAAGGAYVTSTTLNPNAVTPVIARSANSTEFGNFGSPEDFKAAIKELKESLPGDEKVSTNTDVLDLHGFSPNVSPSPPLQLMSSFIHSSNWDCVMK